MSLYYWAVWVLQVLYLYIPDENPLLAVWYVKFISHFVHCLFTLLMVSFPLIIFKKNLWVGKANESLWTTLKLVQGNSKVLTFFHDVGMKWCAYKWSCIYEIHRFSQDWKYCLAFVLSSDFSQWLCGGPTWVFYVSPGVSPFMSFILGLLVIIHYPKFNGVRTEFIIVTAANVL